MPGFANPVSAVMQGLQDALAGVEGIPALAYQAAGAAPIAIKSFFDGVPRSLKPPYLAVGPVGFQPATYDGCAKPPLVRLRVRIYAYATDSHREGAWDMAWAAIKATDSEARRLAGLGALALPEPWGFTEKPAVVQAGDVITPLEPKCVYFDLDMIVGEPR